jgi:intracellular multiplication protein IcmD
MKKSNKGKILKSSIPVLGCLGLMLIANEAFSSTDDVGSMATQIASNFSGLTKLITGGSYLAGLGFSVASIMKFKQHKDNPTQIPIGTPIALVFIAAALLFLPTILGIAGGTMFGAGEGTTSGPSGEIYQRSGGA